MKGMERRIARLEQEQAQPAEGTMIVAMRCAGDTPEAALARVVGTEGPPDGATIVYVMRDFPKDDAPEIAELWRRDRETRPYEQA